MSDITIKRLDEMERYTGTLQGGSSFSSHARASAFHMIKTGSVEATLVLGKDNSALSR